MDERPAPGTRLRFVWRKWDGSPHWVHDCRYLGADAHGDWFGQHPGWGSARPGREFVAEFGDVTLLPPGGTWALTMNAPPHPTRVYIDLAWDAGWRDGVPTGIDMDLDVVDHAGRGIWIDDVDEWEEHSVAYGYPPSVMARLEATADELLRAVTAHEPPFDARTARHWLSVLDRLAENPGPSVT